MDRQKILYVMQKVEIKQGAIRFIWSLIVATLVLLVVSLTTSPLYGVDYQGIDSSIFRVVGRTWAEGGLPYVDAWDLKGPLIFLVDALGYIISPNNGMWGIFLQQVFAFGITIAILYTWCLQIFKQRWHAVLAIGFSVLLLLPLYETGNNVEEFCIPFLTLSFFFFYQWVEKDDVDKQHHSCFAAFVYGMTFGVCAMTRLTNALPICGGIFAVSLYLLAQRQLKNLLLNILSFFGGSMLVILPFIFYFAWHGAVGELWYGTIGYNLDYAGAPSQSMGIKVLYAFNYSPTSISYLIALTGVWLLFYKGKRLLAGMMLSVSIPALLWLSNSNGYAHYGFMFGALPFLYAGIYYLWLYHKTRRAFFGKTFVISVLLLTLPVVVRGRGHFMRLLNIDKQERSIKGKNAQLLEEFVQTNIPIEGRDAVIFYGIPAWVYLQTKITPCYPYFALQEFEASKSKSFTQRIRRSFASCEAQYIIVGGAATVIQPVLDAQYHLAKKLALFDGTVVLLYVRND